MPLHSGGSSDREGEEWTYLTADLADTFCRICEKELRAGQAVGHVRDQFVHARCYDQPTPG